MKNRNLIPGKGDGKRHGNREANEYLRKRKLRHTWGWISAFFGVVVAIAMFQSLKKPAITMEVQTCQMEEHVHTEACYGYDHEETVQETRSELYLDCAFQPHVHTEDCWDENGTLICGYAEEYIHVHDDFCYVEDENGERRLVCGLNGLPEHEHTDECYTRVLVCGQEENPGHIHTDECYTTEFFLDEDPVCGLEETDSHVHSEDCYADVLVCELDHEHTDACFIKILECGMEEGQSHVHTQECYPSIRNLTCELEEAEGHVHDDSCWAMLLDCPWEHVHTEECFDENGHVTCGHVEILRHQHTEECFTPRTIVVKAGHVHSDTCAKVLMCGKEEHVHSSSCFSTVETVNSEKTAAEVYVSDQEVIEENIENDTSELEQLTVNEIDEISEYDLVLETDGEQIADDGTANLLLADAVSEAGEAAIIPDILDEEYILVEEDPDWDAAFVEMQATDHQETASDNKTEHGLQNGESSELPDENELKTKAETSEVSDETSLKSDEATVETDDNTSNEADNTDQSLMGSKQAEIWVVPVWENRLFAVFGLDNELSADRILESADRSGNEIAELWTDSISLQVQDDKVVCVFAFRTAVIHILLADGTELQVDCAYEETPREEIQNAFAYDPYELENGDEKDLSEEPGTLALAEEIVTSEENGNEEEVIETLLEEENGLTDVEQEAADDDSESAILSSDGEAIETDEMPETDDAADIEALASEKSGTEQEGLAADTEAGLATASDLEESMQGENYGVEESSEESLQDARESAEEESLLSVHEISSTENNDAHDSDILEKSEKAGTLIDAMLATDTDLIEEDVQEVNSSEDSVVDEWTVSREDDEASKAQGDALLATGTDLTVEETSEEDIVLESNETELVEEPLDEEVMAEADLLDEASLTFQGEDYQVVVFGDDEAGIPEGSRLVVSELTEAEAVEAYKEKILETTGYGTEQISVLRLFDLEIQNEYGEKIEPLSKVSVVINMSSVANTEMHVIHFIPQVINEDTVGHGIQLMGRQKQRQQLSAKPSAFELSDETAQVLEAEVTEFDERTWDITFETEGFSVYAIVGTTIEKLVLASDGNNYRITAAYGAETGIPADADLAVSEISDESELYREYVAKTENALGMEEGSAEYIRLFDISIVSRDDPGIRYQPAEGTAVDMRVELADRTSEQMTVVHFADGTEEAEAVESVTQSSEAGSSVEFQAGSFSVYSIVDAPEPAVIGATGWYTANSLDQIEELGENGFYVSYNGYYLTGDLVHNVTNNSDRDGLVATPDPYNSVPEDLAAEFYFSRVEGTNTFKIYVEDENGVKNYVKLTSVSGNSSRAGLTLVSEESDGTAFTIEKNGNSNSFYISAQLPGPIEYWWNSNNKDPGKGAFVGYNLKKDQNTAKVTLSYYYTAENDPYDLNGKTFGIAYNDNSVSAAGVSAAGKTVSGQERLEGVDMLIRSDVLTNSGNLLVAENSDIQEWTFESFSEDKYYIKTTVDGAVKYLSISGSNVTLAETPTDASVVKATPGTGSNSGKWHFTVGGYSLNFAGSAANGFNAANSNGASTWLNLVEKSTLTDEDFVEYSARKISASDDILSATQKDDNGEILKDDEGNVVYKSEKTKVVIYTRVWNETTKKYEFYAVDHDGSLVRVYDSGDRINWVGNKVNSALWEFTEYTNTDGTPNYYYELENTAYSGTYLVPQSEGIISDQTVGIYLNGRREGFDYTTIVAWDDNAYAYSGLKIERNADGTLKVVPCPFEDADDFYFAVIAPPVETAGSTSEVTTVDNNEHGISIRMVDFNNTPLLNDRDPVQNPFFGAHPWTQYAPDSGLLSTDLTNGYPTTTAHTGTAGRSLSELFSGMTPANHLFIQSVYNESGYFEYDSTQNFAHLNEDGTFTVYNQLGAIGTSTGPTRAHGQFMPYNDISPETGYAVDSQGNVITNRYDVRGKELSDTDPRKGEPLYLIPQKDADYFFGMELSASFTQTPDGVDNWGHDIIFEFTGDDDFWLYVDEELVLDLGGIHSALPGSVNFRTGEVNVNGTWTTLKTIFYDNYVSREHTAAEADEYVNNIFEQKFDDQGNALKDSQGNDVYTFKNYTNHQMKMFYMERGAGASNLKMRFNLASVKPGTAELTKKLTGTNSSSNKLIQYPYQIWYAKAVYRTNEDGSYALDGNGQRIVDSYTQPVLLEQPSSNVNLTGAEYAAYKGTNTLIPYKDSMSINGQTYSNVFLLRAGETAVLNFAEDTYRYKIVECGVNTQVYEHVFVNGTDITGSGMLYNNTDTGTQAGQGETCLDFGIDYKTTEERPRVEYTNQMAPGVMNTLSFRKQVYGTDDQLLTDEEAAAIEETFTFRLYLGNEYTDENNIPPANMYSYLVKDPDGHYCRWNSQTKAFESLSYANYEGTGGLEEYLATLGSTEKASIVFTTSMNGTISNIHAGYTVEVRDLVVGTKYKVEERDGEIPRGYTRRAADGYVRTDSGSVYVYYTESGTYGQHELMDGSTVVAEPISDTILKNESPMIDVRNQEGWGLSAKKVWTDKDFVNHDDIFLAVYLEDENGGLVRPVGGTVRRLTNSETEAYWFFPDLRDEYDSTFIHSFDEYIVREVTLTGSYTVDADTGAVEGFETITPVSGNTVIGCTPIGGEHRYESYSVSYDIGSFNGRNSNIRMDTITNARPGIDIYKINWDGTEKLSGAVFTLKDSAGNNVAAASYTSGSEGLVTTAYLSPGVYTLDEIKTPTGYTALDEPITITVTTAAPENYDLNVPVGDITYFIALSGPEGFYTAAPATAENMARITVKNRTVQELKVEKVGDDGSTRTPLSGVHFALYDQVLDSDGNLRPAYNPKIGYEDLETNEEGILETVTMSLGAGTYYLREKAAPSGYKKLAGDLCFKIGADGTVQILNSGYSDWLTKDTSVPGAVSYKISIVNTPVGITIRKTDEAGNKLLGSSFLLRRKNDQGIYVNVTEYGLGEGGQIDLTDNAEITITGMSSGTYQLTETNAPAGYIILTKEIYFTVSDGAVQLVDKNGDPRTYSDVSLLDDNTTIAVENPQGVALPNTGGPGTKIFTGTGLFLLAAAGLLQWIRRRII